MTPTQHLARAESLEAGIATRRAANRELASRRLITREVYYPNRTIIRIPVNAVERERNGRWAQLNNRLWLAMRGVR